MAHAARHLSLLLLIALLSAHIPASCPSRPSRPLHQLQLQNQSAGKVKERTTKVLNLVCALVRQQLSFCLTRIFVLWNAGWGPAMYT
jgi:hypothetical protein